MLVQVHQHIFFEGGLAIVDSYALVMSVEAVNQSLNGWLVEMTEIGSALARFLAEHERLWIYEAERIDYDFSLD